MKKKTVFYWSIILLFFCLISCKSPQWHLNQFKKKGGEIKPTIIRDSIPYEVKGKDGKDSTIYIQVEITPDCPTVETNAQTRAKERTKRTEAKEETKQHKSDNKVKETEAKEETKQNKSNNNVEKSKNKRFIPWYVLILIGWLMGIITMLLIKLLRK